MNSKYESLVCRYIKAKDGNKPHLIKSVFSEDAALKMEVRTNNISFPADAVGLSEITDTLISKFNKQYENIYTICLSDTLEQSKGVLNCRWLVGMTEKDSGSSLVGFGGYQWKFEDEGSNLVNHLTIVIENMIVLPQEIQSEVMSWFDDLLYPWSVSSDVLTSMPNFSFLNEVRRNIAQQKCR